MPIFSTKMFAVQGYTHKYTRVTRSEKGWPERSAMRCWSKPQKMMTNLRQIGEEDLIDDKTVFIIKRE